MKSGTCVAEVDFCFGDTVQVECSFCVRFFEARPELLSRTLRNPDSSSFVFIVGRYRKPLALAMRDLNHAYFAASNQSMPKQTLPLNRTGTVSRRSFLKAAALSSAPVILPGRIWSAETALNEKLQIGVIGTG